MKTRERQIHGNVRGFTLIELVIIIAVVGILAGVAIPKYQDMTIDAKSNATKQALGSWREAISNWEANQAVQNGQPDFPDLDSMNTINSVVMQALPRNAFQAEDRAPDSVVLGVTKGVTVGTRGNTNTTISSGGCGGATSINENLW